MKDKRQSKQRTGPKPAECADDAFNFVMWHLNKFGDTSESNLRTKLKRKTDNQEWIDFAINKVIELGYQSDSRYAEIVVRQGMESRSWGRSRVAMELKKKGIPDDVAAEAMAPLDDDDPIARCTEALGKKFRGREITHPEIGQDKLLKVFEKVQDLSNMDVPPRLEGRHMSMMLQPR